MKITRTSVILFFVLVAGGITPSSAQFGIELGAGGGASLPAADFAGTTRGFYSGTSYGLGPGEGINIRSRFRLLGIPLIGEINYSLIPGEGDAQAGVGSISIKDRVFSTKVGPEFTFIPLGLPFHLYLDATVGINDIGGDVSFKGVPGVPDMAYIKNAVARLGVGVSGGAVVPLNERILLDVGLSYNFLNPFLQAWDDVHPSVDQRVDSYLALNDAKDPLYAAGNATHFIGAARRVNLMLVSMDFMFRI